MRPKPSKRLYNIVLVFANDVTRTVKVKASDRDIAERRALKRHPNAVAVNRHG